MSRVTWSNIAPHIPYYGNQQAKANQHATEYFRSHGWIVLNKMTSSKPLIAAWKVGQRNNIILKVEQVSISPLTVAVFSNKFNRTENAKGNGLCQQCTWHFAIVLIFLFKNDDKFN